MPHPWHWHGHRPSRLLWFIFGAVTGAWVMKHKECADNYKVRHCSRHQIPQEAYPPPQGQGAAQNHDWHTQWHNRWRERQQQWGWGPQQQNQEAPSPAGVSATVSDQPAATVDGWDEERQRLLKIKQQAANSLLDFSEEGLDSLLTSMEALKARLAERRAYREEEARAAAEREADFKLFEEWKRERTVQALKGVQPEPKEPPKRLV